IDELEKIHRNKTGAMIRVSALSGAIIAGAGEKELEAISNYASKLGLLFQITDDLLDVTQTTEVLGKTAGKDVDAQKATYPAFYGVDETRRRSEEIYAEAVGNLEMFERPTGVLSEIADFILNRES
ncbi:MAG TPA: polyprenyl synthetase family protein, partial [Pyrinomonadaceae bacterium]|nr:polyprenyl synthetase family protein [Pyrinomonadaceae bacterium]